MSSTLNKIRKWKNPDGSVAITVYTGAGKKRHETDEEYIARCDKRLATERNIKNSELVDKDV